MPAARKITDEELERLRRLHADGWSPQDLGSAFGISPQHAGRLARGEQRAPLGEPDIEHEDADVAEAVAGFLSDAELSTADQVLAATARALAGKLDACARSDSATAAQAAPRLAAQLVDVLGRLSEGVPREPDAIDLLRERRAARLRAAAARRRTSPTHRRTRRDGSETRRRTGRGRPHAPENLVTLCAACHGRLEGHRRAG